MNMNMETFILVLSRIDTRQWSARVEQKSVFRGCIHINKQWSNMLFSPLTCAYNELTGKQIHRGSFWCEELQQEFGFPWWEILKIAYVQIKYGDYDKQLRNKILVALELPPEKIY